MNIQNPKQSEQLAALENFQFFMSLLVSFIGIAIIAFGLKYTIDIFLILYGLFENQDGLVQLLDKWAELLTIKDLVVVIDGVSYRVGHIATFMIIGAVAHILIKITLGITQTGVNVLIQSMQSNKVIVSKKALFDVDNKLTQLKLLSEQGKISTQAYQQACDHYTIKKIMEDL